MNKLTKVLIGGAIAAVFVEYIINPYVVKPIQEKIERGSDKK